MNVAYFIAGRRFTSDGTVKNLNDILKKYELATNMDKHGDGPMTVRRISDPYKTDRYIIVESNYDNNKSCRRDLSDVCIGKVICDNGPEQSDVVMQTSISHIKKVLKEVRQDIPNAQLFLLSRED